MATAPEQPVEPSAPCVSTGQQREVQLDQNAVFDPEDAVDGEERAPYPGRGGWQGGARAFLNLGLTWTSRVRPFSSNSMTQRACLTEVQRDRGMTMTSNGQLVKLSATEGVFCSSRRSGGWYHKAAIVWSRWTSVEDQFTGYVFESVVGEAVHPSAPMYRCWNTLHMVLMLYPVIVAPLVVAFSVHAQSLEVLARIVEVALLVDIIVTFFVAVDVGKTSDHLEQRPLRVAEQYTKTWLLFDLVTSLPWRNLLPIFIGNTGLSWVTETATVRDALQFLQIARYLTIIRRNFYSVFSTQSMQYKQRAVLSFVAMVSMASHWMSCAWMLMAKTYLIWFAHTDEDAFEKTWLSTAGVDLERNTLQSQYIQSLYFSITIMATIGYGDITPQNGFERTLCIMAMILGTWAYAYCITQLVDMVASWQSADVRFKAHQDDLIEYMRARNLPQGVQTRILKFYDFQRQHAAVFYKEDEILNQLTPNLRAEVAHFAHYDTVRLLKGMKLFENLEDTLLTRLIVALTTQFLPPDELVCAEGELGEVLYIIRKGVVSVIKHGIQQALLTDGQSFGETVLYSTTTKRNATIITRSYCQLMLLSKAAVQAALQSRPQQYEALQEKAKKIYQAYLTRSRVLGIDRDQMDDTAIWALQQSLSMSQDVHLEAVIPSVAAAGEGMSAGDSVDRARQDSLLENSTLSTAILPIRAARPSHDRPTTFD